ncbi:hypothetical protein ACQJBY_043590 [Aegilops geniculata]
MLKLDTILLLLVVCVVPTPQDMIYYFSKKYFPAHKKQAALQEIFNFAQIEEESLPQAWGRLLQLLINALPDHPLKKNEILDIFYNGLTDASRDFIDSCVSRKRTIGQAEELLNNILKIYDDWILPEPPLKLTPKKRGILYLSPEDMQEAKKSMREKGIKAKDVKNLPPSEEIHGLNTPPPPRVVETRVGPPSTLFCRTVAIFPQVDDLRFINPWEV